MRKARLGLAAGTTFLCTTAASALAPVLSPDGTIRLVLDGEGGQPRYQVERRGEAVLAPSPLGLLYADGPPPGAVDVTEVGRSTVDRRVPVVAGRTSQARDHYNEAVFALRDQATGGTVQLVVRAYDDGIAFRYVVPADPRPAALRDERTGFYLPSDDSCWGLNVGRTTSSHEGEFERFQASRARPHNLFDMGLLCRTQAGRTNFLFAEADLDRYAGLYLRGREDGGLGFEASLSPLPGETRRAVRVEAGQELRSPWRVVLMADRAGDLIASNTIGNLNLPPVGDWRWVKPGKSAWDWWSGPHFPDHPVRGTNAEDTRRLIDFASSSGFAYMLIDEGWAKGSGIGGSAPADTDITAGKPGMNMHELASYAAGKGVGLLLWLQWSQLDKRMDEALDQYARWGVKGVKVDFMDRNDQEMVAFYHRLVEAAAKRHLLVDLHGAYLPTGLSRTYPNYITQEGVMGAEYNKWSNRVTAEHNVDLAFTRLPLGPMDYTPGGFRNHAPSDFHFTNSPPQVQTTRGQALALFVVYESPLTVVADSPDAYADAPEFEFIKDVPTSWDETRFLDGEPGSHVTVARRKGDVWYVGAITNGTGRTITLPLSFLKAGHHVAQVWQDGAAPTEVVASRQEVGPGDALTLRLAPSGGAVITIRPSEPHVSG